MNESIKYFTVECYFNTSESDWPHGQLFELKIETVFGARRVAVVALKVEQIAAGFADDQTGLNAT